MLWVHASVHACKHVYAMSALRLFAGEYNDAQDIDSSIGAITMRVRLRAHLKE